MNHVCFGHVAVEEKSTRLCHKEEDSKDAYQQPGFKFIQREVRLVYLTIEGITRFFDVGYMG